LIEVEISKLNFVTGKGGVGKTFVTNLIREGFRKLELAKTHPKAALTEEFLFRTLKFHAVARFLSQSKALQNLLSLAPNLEEILKTQKWIAAAKDQSLVVDSPSTGNFISIFQALQTATELFDGGSLKKMALESMEFFGVPGNASVFIVSIPEKSSISESLQIDQYLKATFPAIRRIHILNRKHQLPSEDSMKSASIEWASFIRERCKREEARMNAGSLKWDLVLHENQRSL